MIRALVSVYPDLSSVIAINYACRLSRIIDMGIQPIFVKEPEPGAEAPAVGWVRHTWENSLLGTEREAVDRLIASERDHCAILARPQILVGDRDDTILTNLLGGTYDLFVEGCLASYEKSEFLERVHSKLYRNLPCPVIIARNLIELHKILIVYGDGVDVEGLLAPMIRLFNGTRLRFDLLYCRLLGTGTAVEPIEDAQPLFSKADKILLEHEWTPENRLALQGTPQDMVRQMEDYSLIVTSLPQMMGADNELMCLVGDTPSPILLCRQ